MALLLDVANAFGTLQRHKALALAPRKYLLTGDVVLCSSRSSMNHTYIRPSCWCTTFSATWGTNCETAHAKARPSSSHRKTSLWRRVRALGELVARWRKDSIIKNKKFFLSNFIRLVAKYFWFRLVVVVVWMNIYFYSRTRRAHSHLQ